ncbi:unnamed protein product [Rotaria sp. Silwood2]|nr:unnamed protein product [Rotaria sp. Silwood2]
MATSSNNINDLSGQQQLKQLKENWRKANRRGYGFYAKKPDRLVMNNLKYALVTSSTTINDDLCMPNLSTSNWLNLTVGALISIKYIRESTVLSRRISTPLLYDIVCFISKWLSMTKRIKPQRKNSTELINVLNTNFQIPPNFPVDGNKQLNIILHEFLLPIIDCSIPAIKTYRCAHCNFSIQTRFDIKYITINMTEGSFQLCHRLNNYFDGSVSDHLCDKCSTIIFLGPPVIVVQIHNENVSSTAMTKPPNAIFFQSFVEKLNIGCASSHIYDIIGFLSIMPHTDNKLTLVTKIKQRWQVSSMMKLVGNGEKLCKLFAYSRLLILERTRTCNSNFLYAIAQCCSFVLKLSEPNELKICKTLSDAVKVIESNSNFRSLKSMLSSYLTTYYRCQSCDAASNSLFVTYNGICIYDQNTELKTIYGTPLKSSNIIDLTCSSCLQKMNNIILPINNQTHHRFPAILMYYLSQATLSIVQNVRVDLMNYETQSTCQYKATSILVVDEYNSISIIKLDPLALYDSSPYQKITTTSFDMIVETFHTAQKIVVFMKPVNTTAHESPNPVLLAEPVPIRIFNKADGKISFFLFLNNLESNEEEMVITSADDLQSIEQEEEMNELAINRNNYD